MENEQLNRSLELLNEFAEKGIDFVIEQSPLLCEEIIVRAQITNGLYAVTLFVFLAIYIIGGLKMWSNTKYLRKNDEDRVAFGILFTLTSLLILGLPIVGFVDFTTQFLVATFAPRVYLFEYFTRLIS